MARPKAVCTCCALLLLLMVIIIAITVAVTVMRKCPNDRYSKAALAADTRRCSEIGRDMLQRGGSAVDGAIAALLCTGIMNPQSAGIGGGSIFTVMDSSGKVRIINARETAPSKVDPDLLKSCHMTSGSKWIGVPGEIRGYEKAHKLYGKLPWAALFQPTIKLAREGFPIPPPQGLYITNVERIKHLRQLYSDKNGTLLKTGDIIKFEKLADTLELIANNGADAFYNGTIAKHVVQDVQQAGGTLELQDLASYKVTLTDAWVVPMGEHQMYVPPPPYGGALLSFVLNIMKGYSMNSAPQSVDEKTLFYHRYVEAFKFANGLKNRIRDPRFKSDEMAKEMLDESFAERIRALISSDGTNNPQYYNVMSDLDSLGTTHVSVLAEDGSAVGVSSSINDIFGSKVYSPNTGILLNNQLTDFCGRVDSFSPGEQPPSFMAPAVLRSPSKTLVIGASGGSWITTGLASALINHLWFGKSLKEAIATPVLFVDSANTVKFEPSLHRGVIKALEVLGHNQTSQIFYNVVNAVEKMGDCICAVSDDRKQGEAAGF